MANIPVSVTKIVFLGIATGSVVWIPLAWWEMVPPAKVAIETSATPITMDVRPKPTLPTPAKLEELMPLPGGGLPMPLERVEPTAEAARPVQPDRYERPTPAPETNAAEKTASPSPARPLSQPVTQVRVAEEGQLPAKQATAASISVRQPDRVAVASFDSPVAAIKTATDDETDTIRLMHDLNDEDPATAEAAANALTAQGFSETHLQLARQLTSPNPAERSQLAAILPSVTDIDPRLWLTWLLRDEDAGVRVAALSVLATTGDPDTIRRVVEIVRQDRDPRVRQQLLQIEKLQRGAR